MCCARITKFLPFLFFHSFFLFFFFMSYERRFQSEEIYVSRRRGIFLSRPFFPLFNYSRLFPVKFFRFHILYFLRKKLGGISFSPTNQPTNVSIRSLSCIVTSKVWSEKRHLPSSQTSPHKPFPRGQGTDVADSSPRNPPSPSTAKLFVVKGDFSRTK